MMIDNLIFFFFFLHDTVVLGKNGRHSLGSTQYRIPAPTSKNEKKREKPDRGKKSIEFGNGKKARPQNERPSTR